MRITSSQTASTAPLSADDAIDPNQQALGRVMSLVQNMASQLEQDGPTALQTPELKEALNKLTSGLTELQTASAQGELSTEQQAQLTQLLNGLGIGDSPSAA